MEPGDRSPRITAPAWIGLILAVVSLALLVPPAPLAAQGEFSPPSTRGSEVEALKPAVEDLIGQLKVQDGLAVAVVDFTDLSGDVLELGRFLAEETSVLLVQSDTPLRVITRTRLRALLEEHKLTPTGLLNPDEVKELGLVAGVDVLVTGTTTPLDQVIRVSLQALTTETGDVVAAVSTNIPVTRGIDGLTRREVGRGLAGGSEASTANLSIGEYQGRRISQRIEYLEVELETIELIGADEIRLMLTFRNVSPAGADLTVGWVGTCDRYSNSPVITDDQGRKYLCYSASGPGSYSEGGNVLRANSEATFRMVFHSGDSGPQGTIFTFSAPIYLSHRVRDRGSPTVANDTIFLRNIRPQQFQKLD